MPQVQTNNNPLAPDTGSRSKLLYVQVKVQGELFNCLLDCGASHNSVSHQVVQALELPVLAAADRLQVKLPNGNKLDCDTLCKVHLEFPG